ncbi:MAG: beta-L-arabinofuranosidase domain-containing protein [Bacteroidota bacterium]
MEETEGIKLIAVATNNGDMENVGDGKAYQILWNLTNLAKLYELTNKSGYLKAVENAWVNVRDFHLTIAGGPWGGIGKHLECFNRKNYWSPYGFVETCSTMQWIELNKQMLHLTGDAKYAQEIERAAYNALLGARYTNGVDWSYHSFTNGSWHVAHFNDCCPSSGVMALEELVGEIFSKRENGIAVNLITDGEAKIGNNRISVKTNYPFDGKVTITTKGKVPLFIRIPDWAVNATVDGETAKAGEYFRTEKNSVTVNLPMELKLNQAKEDALVPQGKGEDIYSVNWFALSRGPLVFSADGLIDNRDRERTFTLPKDLNDVFKPVTNPYGAQPAYEMTSGEEKLLFVPYYEAGGAKLNNWRLTWIQTKIE